MHKKMKNIISKIILFSIIYLGFFTFLKAQVLSVDDFEKKYSESSGAQLIDVRTAGEYGGGHLPKATNVDYRSADFQEKIKWSKLFGTKLLNNNVLLHSFSKFD